VIDNLETASAQEIIELTDGLPPTTNFLLTSRVGLGELERRVPREPLSEQAAEIMFRKLAERRDLPHLKKLPATQIRAYVGRLRHRRRDGEQDAKTERSAGTVPMSRQLARELKTHRLREGHPGRDEFVFTGPGGGRLEERNYRRRVLDPACNRAGLTPIGYHVLRHTHGTIVAAETRDVRVVQRRLRHASASFTLDTYIHLLDDRAGADAVAKALDAGE
jgi:hypothetical protein